MLRRGLPRGDEVNLTEGLIEERGDFLLRYGRTGLDIERRFHIARGEARMDILRRGGDVKLGSRWSDLLITHSEVHPVEYGLYGMRVLEVGAELSLEAELPRKWCLGEAQALEVEVNELQPDTCIDALAGEDPVKLERKVCPGVHAVEGEPEVPRLEGAVEGDVLQMHATPICLMQSASDRKLCMRA